MRSASHLHLYLLVVNMCITTVSMVRAHALAAFGGFAQAIPAHGKVVHLPNTFFFALPCPVTHVTMERHLHGIPRDGLLPKIHTLDGARGPFVAIIAENNTSF